MTAEAAVAGEVTNAVVRSFIEKARTKNHGRIVAIRANPAGERRAFEDHGERVNVVPCVSSLAVRAELLGHTDDSWLVILTDRTEEDLGAGILAHFVGNQLRNPDPWEAVRQRFGANSLDRALVRDFRRPEIAQGLLRIAPDDGWAPAPAGVLTAHHAFSCVAREQLGLSAQTVDLAAVLEWSFSSTASVAIADLRTAGGNELANAVLAWIARRCGDASAPVHQLLLTGQSAEAFPLGIALAALLTPNADARIRAEVPVAAARLEHRWAGAPERVTTDSLAALGHAAETLAHRMLGASRTWAAARSAIDAAEGLLGLLLGGEKLDLGSDLLPSSLDARFRRLAAALSEAPQGTQRIEAAWADVSRHRLLDADLEGTHDTRVRPFHAAVRLARWLAEPEEPVSGLPDLAMRQSAVDAWVDAAYNDAFAGVADRALAPSIEHVLRAVEVRRQLHDREFAVALAASTSRDNGAATGYLEGDAGRVWLLEKLVLKVVLPLASQQPVLLVVLDGMSTATASELVQTIVAGHEGWNEVLPRNADRRQAALAVLPTLTEFSRTSLLCGQLTSGAQKEESAGFRALAGSLKSSLHHKKILDSSRPGFALSDEVWNDITGTSADGTVGVPLVACVLNTIDDALDRSDPGGTVWNQDAVKHLRPLLAAALATNRAVVLTADHGHIVERRRGTQRSFPEISSSRSRAATGPVGEDEVLVEGRRVVAHGGRAVLAVDETLRYGPLKAGYHGGAAPAEAVVPVAVLVPATQAEPPKNWKFAGPQEPLWWSSSPATSVPLVVADASMRGATPTLFDEFTEEKPAAGGLGAAVIASKAFKAQLSLAGRVSIEKDSIALLIDRLAATQASRLAQAEAAVVLNVPIARMRGALAQVQKLLNVEGYGVLRADGSELVLDVALLREQFEVGS